MDFAILKNMHITVKCDLQFEKSYFPCLTSEIEEHSKILSSYMKKKEYHL